MSRDTRLMFGLTLVIVPTIVFGGFTLLGVLTRGVHGMPGAPELTEQQYALYRAGHAHAGVLMLLSLALQLALDNVSLSRGLTWALRISSLLMAIVVSAGFFGIAHLEALRIVLYAGVLLVVVNTFFVGVALIRARRAGTSRSAAAN